MGHVQLAVDGCGDTRPRTGFPDDFSWSLRHSVTKNYLNRSLCLAEQASVPVMTVRLTLRSV